MLEEYIKYLDSNFTKEKQNNGTTIYKNNNSEPVIKIYRPLNENEIAKVEKEYKRVSRDYKRGEQVLPLWCKQLFLETNGVDLYFESISIDGKQRPDDFGSVEEYNHIRPKCIPDDYVGIGRYNYDATMIYADMEGKVFVYENFHQIELFAPIKKLWSAKLKIIAEYNSISEFLIMETERLTKLYEKTPWDSLLGKKETVPQIKE